MTLMIDTSHVGQGMLPLSFFQAARTAGVTDFCVKAGGADDGLYKDAAHDQSVTFARQVGGHIHHYFFNGPAATPAQCADAFYQYANPQPGDVLWWDIEPETGMAAWSASQIAAADAQLVTEHRPIVPGVYLNQSEILSGQYNTRAGDPLWEAAYIAGPPSTGAWHAYMWWQYTDSLLIDGIHVDASRPGTQTITTPRKVHTMSTLYKSTVPSPVPAGYAKAGTIWALAGDGQGDAAWLETADTGFAAALEAQHGPAAPLTWASYVSWKARYQSAPQIGTVTATVDPTTLQTAVQDGVAAALKGHTFSGTL